MEEFKIKEALMNEFFVDLFKTVSESQVPCSKIVEDIYAAESAEDMNYVKTVGGTLMVPVLEILKLQEKWAYKLQLEKECAPKTKILFVEDGSVDFDELSEELSLTNPEIKCVLYRQGGSIPRLEDVNAPHNN